MFSQDRATLRLFFVEAWAKARTGEALEPLEAQIAQIVRMHPEYHPLLESDEDVLDREWLPELGESNPFLHLALHTAVLEQVTTDRPPGIRKLHQTIVANTGDVHEAEHRIMECLAQTIWHIQAEGKPFDEQAYLECIRRAGDGRRGER